LWGTLFLRGVINPVKRRPALLPSLASDATADDEGKPFLTGRRLVCVNACRYGRPSWSEKGASHAPNVGTTAFPGVGAGGDRAGTAGGGVGVLLLFGER